MRRILPKLFAGLTIAIVLVLAQVPAAQANPNDSVSAATRWIDVNLSSQTATAYVGNTPVHVAPVSTGKPGWETITGTFSIWRRVYNETMDSETIGVPRDSSDGYYLTDILFTQYLTSYDGTALHYNWWAPRSVFGKRPTSHGCVGMGYGDAAYFWDFADIGTPVVIHY